MTGIPTATNLTMLLALIKHQRYTGTLTLHFAEGTAKGAAFPGPNLIVKLLARPHTDGHTTDVR